MSALKSILLHLDASPRSVPRLQIAARIAHDHDAHVTALYAVSPMLGRFPLNDATVETAAALRDIEHARQAAARAAFDAAEAHVEPDRLEWAAGVDDGEREFTHQSRYADLVILGQREPGQDAVTSLSPDFVESTLIESGRPTLVVPYVASPPLALHVTVVAWKNTRESARALAAALPFLRRSSEVHVVAWDDETLEKGPLDVEAYLRLHGVACHRLHRGPAPSGDVGDALLSLLADLSAGLLVMGCYGHSRAREWVLGGTTRSVLASMTVPVLMSH